MTTVAYCARSFYRSVLLAAGTKPLTSPPYTLHTLDPYAFQDAGFLYLKLHGFEGEPYLYGDNYATALSCDQIARLDLSNTVVFSACCFFLDSPWPAAFQAANVKALVAGHGQNYARAFKVAGADHLGRLFRLFTTARMDPAKALTLARLCLVGAREPATQDARDFELLGLAQAPAGDDPHHPPAPNCRGAS